MCFSWYGKPEDEEDHPHKKHWIDIFIISSESKIYILFNLFITILCLASSYYYGSIAGFRYSNVESDDLDHLIIQITFESIFLIHFIAQFLLDYTEEGKN